MILTPREYGMLQTCFLFSKMRNAEMNAFLKSKECKILEFSKGEVIFGKNEVNNGLGLLLKGKAMAACSTEKDSSIKVFGSGEVFGAASVFCEKKNHSFATVKANTACKVLFIEKEGIKKLLHQSPETALNYIGLLSERVEFLNRRISTFTSSQAVERLCKYIIENENDLDNVNFASLARTLDISRASLYRARGEIEKTNSVEFGSKSIKIINKTELMKILNKE